MATSGLELTTIASTASAQNTSTEPKKTKNRFNYLEFNLTKSICQNAANGTDLKSIAATIAVVIIPIIAIIAAVEAVLFLTINPFIALSNRISGPVEISQEEESPKPTTTQTDSSTSTTTPLEANSQTNSDTPPLTSTPLDLDIDTLVFGIGEEEDASPEDTQREEDVPNNLPPATTATQEPARPNQGIFFGITSALTSVVSPFFNLVGFGMNPERNKDIAPLQTQESQEGNSTFDYNAGELRAAGALENAQDPSRRQEREGVHLPPSVLSSDQPQSDVQPDNASEDVILPLPPQVNGETPPLSAVPNSDQPQSEVQPHNASEDVIPPLLPQVNDQTPPAPNSEPAPSGDQTHNTPEDVIPPLVQQGANRRISARFKARSATLQTDHDDVSAAIRLNLTQLNLTQKPFSSVRPATAVDLQTPDSLDGVFMMEAVD